MSGMIAQVVSNYNEILEINKDPEVDSWLFMSSPTPMLLILAAYLAFVLKIGPKMMENRPGYELKTVLILYNGFQVLFSIFLTNLVFSVDLVSLVHAALNDDCSKAPLQLDRQLRTAISTSSWWYFVSKLTELLDTVFFVLRKKYNQVTFLHVYHHTVIAFFSWFYLKYLPGEQGMIVGFLNTSVHIVMYAYYLIAALGPQYKKYLWWKKYMTWMQLIQFMMMFTYLMFTLTMDCRMPKALSYFFLTHVVIFLYLFGDFYRKAYSKPKKA